MFNMSPARKTRVVIVLWLLLSACSGQSTDHMTISGGVPIQIHTPTINKTTISESVGGTIDAQPPFKYLCVISSLPKTWPVDVAIAEWNKNRVNLFKYDSPSTLCKEAAKINLVEEKMACCWGQAEFVALVATIKFDPTVPGVYRQHVLCHELGHVLGLNHSKEKSCMNINKTNPLPSPSDLSSSAGQEWTWSRVVKALHDESR